MKEVSGTLKCLILKGNMRFNENLNRPSPAFERGLAEMGLEMFVKQEVMSGQLKR